MNLFSATDIDDSYDGEVCTERQVLSDECTLLNKSSKSKYTCQVIKCIYFVGLVDHRNFKYALNDLSGWCYMDDKYLFHTFVKSISIMILLL